MNRPNLRKWLYFVLFALRGQPVGDYYRRMLSEVRNGIPADTRTRALMQMLTHCQHHVPYYAQVMDRAGDAFEEDPESYLLRLPILTKDILRSRFDDLKSDDLARRKWHVNTSSGSTGEPITVIQDSDYRARAGAIKFLYSELVGRQLGEVEVMLWGSHRDRSRVTGTLGARSLLLLSRTTFLDSSVMTPERMRYYIAQLNTKRPKLITAYSDAIYELAMFAERESLPVRPQAAIMTSAGMLHPFMREKIEAVFQCKVYNRYGSREAGDIACERPGARGLWVAPWGNFVEIVNSDGERVPDGCEGDVLVTSLSNYAMPLIRYKIGDRGRLAPCHEPAAGPNSQIIQEVLGRENEMFAGKSGQLIHASYFAFMLYFRDWIWKYQVIQKSRSRIVFRLASATANPPQSELDDLVAQTRQAMGDDCTVEFEFVTDIPASRSGKFRYIISEIATPEQVR